MESEQNNLNKNSNYSQSNSGVVNNQPFNNQSNNGVVNNQPFNNQSNNGVVNNQENNNNNSVNQTYQNIKYATFGDRLVAILRDYLRILLIGFIAYTVIFIINIIIRSSGVVNDSIINTFFALQIFWPMLFILLGHPFYAMIGDISKNHASKGKYKRNIFVLDKNGNFLSFGQSFLRMVLKYVTLILPYGLIVTIITMCCTKKKQAIHDLILGHVVVKDVDGSLKTKNINNQSQNKVLIIFTIIGGIIISFVVSFLIFYISTNLSRKLVCESSMGNITIIYNKNQLVGFFAEGIVYDIDTQNEIAKEIGVDNYLIKFNDWFKSNTFGTCTINGEEISN